MCGIIGAISNSNISKKLINGLKYLEYRGYDSAGITVINYENNFNRIRILGKVKKLEKKLDNKKIVGKVGIAHTRWATHGKPCTKNAHPHLSNNEIAIVHNGIIENHNDLRNRLKILGYNFYSDTDTEVAVHLIHYYYKKYKNFLISVQEASIQMYGSFAIGVIHKHHPELLVAVCNKSPLVIGLGNNEIFIASDSIALQDITQSIIYLEDGDSAQLTSNKILLFDVNKNYVVRKLHKIKIENYINKGAYKHFMLKEIYEQPNTFKKIIEFYLIDSNHYKKKVFSKIKKIYPYIKNIHIVACGSSYHAGLVAKYWLESISKISTQVEIASEYLYRDLIVKENTLFVSISQSGETADILASLKKAKNMNYISNLAICNTPNSTLVRESEYFFITYSGIEISVASTKSFTSQLMMLLIFAATLCKCEKYKEVLQEICQLPNICENILRINRNIQSLAYTIARKKYVLYLGRGMQYPIALEGALKLKEISYIYAEAYPAGELKHGPLSLIDKQVITIAIAPTNSVLNKLKLNLCEISSRNGRLVIFVDNYINTYNMENANIIYIPYMGNWITPIIYTVPLQLLAYYTAFEKGTNIDQPRNLAKSVTVE